MTLWEERDMPILRLFAEAEEAGATSISTPELAKALGRDLRDARVGVDSLREAGYIDWADRARYVTDHHVLLSPRVRERGRRTLGQWPADGYSALVALLEAQIQAEPDDEKRGRLEQFRSALLGMGRDVATDLLSKLLAQVAGLK
jgi:hypothetical protein